MQIVPPEFNFVLFIFIQKIGIRHWQVFFSKAKANCTAQISTEEKIERLYLIPTGGKSIRKDSVSKYFVVTSDRVTTPQQS